MAVLWGLDLREMQRGKFGNNYMWKNTEYHMRRTRFIIYQCAMILTVVSESLGTAALSDYIDQQKYVSQNPDAIVHNDNFIGIASYNIFVGIYVATVFGSAFFFDLFWPERQESKAVKLAWKACSILACMLTLSCALAYTYIVATQSAHITGPDPAASQRLLVDYAGSPLRYRDNGRAIASVVFLWPGMVFTFVSAYLLWHSLAHIDAHGPKSGHARTGDNVVKPSSEKPIDIDRLAHSDVGGTTVAQPEQLHVRSEGDHDSEVTNTHDAV